MGDNNVPPKGGRRLREEKMTDTEKFFMKKIKSKLKNVNIELKTKDNGYQTLWFTKEERELSIAWTIPVADLKDKTALDILIQDCRSVTKKKNNHRRKTKKRTKNKDLGVLVRWVMGKKEK